MGSAHSHPPVMLLVAAFSRHDEALAWARAKCEAAWGKIALSSPAFQFGETQYYRATMGDDLKKQFFVFELPFDPGELAEIKLQTNQWEAEYAALGKHPESRPLNLDPGYLTLAKLVLASTKDHSHRLYIGRGIHAEITLTYRDGGWQPSQWTYPDYRRADFQAFFTLCRNEFKRRR